MMAAKTMVFISQPVSQSTARVIRNTRGREISAVAAG